MIIYKRTRELYHYGVKGMKWGVHKRDPKIQKLLKYLPDYDAAAQKNIASGEVYLSRKGFFVQTPKIGSYMLKPGAKHSIDFYNVGYKPSKRDWKKLFRDIEAGFDIDKAFSFRRSDDGAIQFDIMMELGVDKRRTFLTGWRIDSPNAIPRLTTAFRRNK